MKIPFSRSPLGTTALIVLALTATGAGAATVHRLALSEAAGSEGATAALQTVPSMSAIQGEVNTSATTNFTVPFATAGLFDPPSSSNPPFGIGLLGISTTGYGVAGEAFSSNPAIIALNQGTGDAIVAAANGTSGNAIVASATRTAIYASSSSGNGLVATTSSPYESGIAGYDTSTASNFEGGGFGVTGITTVQGGFGMFGGGENADAIGVVGEGEYTNSKTMPGFSAGVLASTYSIGEDLFAADIDDIESMAVTAGSANASGTVTNNPSAYGSDISDNGDLYLTGAVYTHCTTFPYPMAKNCTKGADAELASDGAMRETYASRHAAPTMEDEGETHLQAGVVHVALDPAFASMISTAAPYMVFVTPQGDNRGLYVTHITPTGFDVRESGGGRSTMVVDYRIVAHPYADTTARLAIARPATMHMPSAKDRALFHKRLAAARAMRELAPKPDTRALSHFFSKKV